MIRYISIATTTLAALLLVGCGQGQQAEPVSLDSKDNKASYQLGYEMARQMQRDSVAVNAGAMAQGARDALAGSDSKVSDEAIATQVANIAGNYARVRKEMLAELAGQQNLQAGQQFLAQNGKKEGVVTTASGLQYKVITEGTGSSPAATDKVEVHYHGTLVDGRVFDSSVDRGETIAFGLDGVIGGWTEGLQLMKEGGKYEFYIPTDLAYGANPRPGGVIGPNMALIFEVELFKVNP